MSLTKSQLSNLHSSTKLPSATLCKLNSKSCFNSKFREISVNLENKILNVLNPETGENKEFNLEGVSYKFGKDNTNVKLKVSDKKIYDLNYSKGVNEILKIIDNHLVIEQLVEKGFELHVPKPCGFNYGGNLPLMRKITSHQSVNETDYYKELSDYGRELSYYRIENWARDSKNGGLLLTNQEKKKMVPEMIGYVAKKIATSGSFTTMSLPTFSMKPESLLETLCKSLGASPLIFSHPISDSIERIKAFNTILLTMSIGLSDLEKSFTPFLGETFQAEIGGLQIYAEHINFKPSISFILLIGKGFKLYGPLELCTEIGVREAIGYFHGELTLEFNDGGICKGIIPKGSMSGILFGETRFHPIGAAYSYNPRERIVCSYEYKKKDHMEGYIGKMKDEYFAEFEKSYKTRTDGHFKHVPEKHYEQIITKMSICWTDSISYDDKIHFKYSDPNCLPITLVQKKEGRKEALLQSDCSFRNDIKLRKENNMKDSQQENERLEELEQAFQKLRKKEEKS